MKIYQRLAQLVQRALRHEEDFSGENLREELSCFVYDYLPSGSGLDRDVEVDLDRCTDNKIVLDVAYHHMDKHGYYVKWTSHSIILTPDWNDINIKVTGRDHNFIKDYLADIFYQALTEEVSFHLLAPVSWPLKLIKDHCPAFSSV